MSAETAERAWDELTLSPAEYRQAGARYRQRRSFRAYLFLVPYLVPFLAFLVVPVFWSIWLSFNQGGLLDSAKFVGFQNWRVIGADT
jgi:ABC-type sugar transport system permease subunit